jgi:SAM-dependent methyltransferase
MTHLPHTVERIHPHNFRSLEKQLLYQRHVFAYEYVLTRMPPAQAVLDVGMGDGYGSLMLANAGHDVTGVDADAPTVAAARARHEAGGLRFLAYDGDRLPFDDETFDVVTAMQVIEHVETDVAFVQELRRVLKRGGRCWLTTPNRPFRVENDRPVWNPFHVREYWHHQLDAILRPIFADVHVNGIGARTDIREVERQRVRRGFSFRKLVPEAVRARLVGCPEGQHCRRLMHVTAEDETAEAIDLIAECRRVD